MRALFEIFGFRMPYYCTVPKCTSMSGKIENVSFHRFPQDKELADLWNTILQRRKPYTKYSKVCSLHFKPEDFISSNNERRVWRTLKKKAVPSMNLPYIPSLTNSNNILFEAQLQDHVQLAHSIYSHTMLAMQAAGCINNEFKDEMLSKSEDYSVPNRTMKRLRSQSVGDGDVELESKQEPIDLKIKTNEALTQNRQENSILPVNKTYSCTDCSKCYKDYDVFLLHTRTHKSYNQKENNISNDIMIKSNPILANQLALDPEKSIFSLMNIDKKIINETL